MKRTINKKIIIALLSALVAVCAGFALLLSRPAAQAKAEESYSETWVIKENWQYYSFDVSISFSSGDVACIGLSTTQNTSEFFLNINVNPQKGTFLSLYTGSSWNYFDLDYNSLSYSEWKDTFGKLTFYEDTSAEKFTELRTWLNANAVKQTSEEPAPVTYTLTFKDGYSGDILGMETINKDSVISNEIADKYQTIAQNKANGRVIDCWLINEEISDFPSDKKISGDTIIKVNYFGLVNFFNEGKVVYSEKNAIDSTLSLILNYDDPQLAEEKISFINNENFLGWANAENSSTILDTSYQIKYGGIYNFYAVFKTSEEPAPVTYTVTFNDGEKVLYTLSVESGKAVNLAEHPEINESAAKTGYTFKGWAVTKDGAVIVKNGYIPNVTADTTFYAVYTEGIEPTEPTNPDNPDVPESTEYKVVFLVDNLVAYTATVKNGKAVSFADYPELSEKIKKDGYSFKGWKIEGQDEVYTDGIPVQNKTTVLVAVYEKKVLGIDGVSKAGSIVLTAAIGIVGVYFLFKLFGGKRRRR